MIEGALLTINVIMAVIFIALSLWCWIKKNDMQSMTIFLVIAVVFLLDIFYLFT